LAVPYRFLYPLVLVCCCIGTYSVNNNLDDIFITAAFGFLGYVFMRLDMDAALLLASAGSAPKKGGEGEGGH